jgi:Spy/CpxP family protein refolding chaperone
MNIKRKLTSLTTAVALAATTLAPMATSASAEPWRDGNRNYARSDRGDFNRGGDRGDWNRGGDRGGDWNRGGDRGRHDFYAYRRHKHHDTGKYIALGIGALMLGIMASEAGRH